MKSIDRVTAQWGGNWFKILFKNYPRAMWIYDLKTLSFLDVNDAAVKIYGYSRKKFLTMTLKDIRPGKEVHKLLKNISLNRPSFQQSGIWKHQLKNGKVIDVEIISHTINFENHKAAIVIAKDVSNEVKLHNQLVAAKAELRTTLYSIGDGVISVDSKSRILMMNKAAEKLTGWKESEAKGKLLSNVFKIVNEETRKKAVNPVDKVLKRGIVVGLANHTLLIMKDGTERPIADSGAPIKDENGNIVGVVLVFRDQSKERQLFKRISKLNRVYSIISDTNQAIVRIKDKKSLFKQACKIAVEDGGFVLAWVGLLDKNSSKVNVIEFAGKSHGYLNKINIDLIDKARSKGITGQAFKTGKYVISNNILKDSKMQPWHKDAQKYKIYSSAAFPIKIYGKVVGTFNLYSTETNYFSKEEVKLFDELASDLSFALEFFEEERKRKQIEIELLRSKSRVEESERKFTAITNQATEGIALSNLEGHYVFVNPAFCKMTGYSEKELLQMTVFDLKAKDQPTVFFKSKNERQGIPLEIKLKRKDGSEFYTEIIGRVITIDNKQFVLGTVRDITERKNSELALNKSETKYHHLYENLRDAFVQTDMEGHFIEYNVEYLRLLGYEPNEINGLTYKDITPAKWHQFENEIVKNQVLVKGYSEVYEKEYRKKDGTIFPVELRTVLVTDVNNQPEGMWAIIRDISNRKKNETALKESEYFLKQSQLVAGLGSYVLDIKSGIWECSDLLDNIFGIDNLYPHTIEGWVNIIHPDFRSEMIEYFQNEILLNHKRFNKEYRIIRPNDGTERWVHGLGELEFDDTNHPVKMLGTIQDITNRKLSEQALRQSEEQKRIIIESLPVAIYESPFDTENDTSWVSSSIEGLTGYTVSEYLSENDFWRSRLHPDDREKVLNQYISARKTEYFEMEYRWLCKNGEYKWFYDKSVSFNKFGKKEYLGVIIDINELKQAEESLKIAEVRYRKFFEEDLSGDFISTTDGKILTCNPAFARIFGYASVDEIMKVSSNTLYKTTSDREQFLNLIREKKSLTVFEENLVTKDGKPVTVLENVVGEFNEKNELVQLQGYLFDITARKKMEEAVQNQLKFAIAANKISEIIITTDEQLKILESSIQIIGETLSADRALIYKVNFKNNLAMGLCEWIDPNKPDVQSTKANYLLSYFNSSAAYIQKTKKLITSHDDEINPNFYTEGSADLLHKQMKIKSLLWYPFAFHDEGYYLLVINQVHSIRKWNDDEIVFLDTISKQISIAFKKIELTEEIKLSRTQLKTLSNRLEKSREEERTRISREIHDILGQNLTAVKIDLVNLLKNLPDKDNNEQKVEPLIKLIEDSIDTVRKISSDLRPGILDQLGLIDSLEWQLSEFENRTKIKTSYVVQDQSINLSKDKTIAMFRVFQELLTNIVRHSEADEVKVNVSVEDGYLILAVADNGKGIDESSIKNPNSIGLLGMRERIAAVGGSLKISGISGEGTKANVIVPLNE